MRQYLYFGQCSKNTKVLMRPPGLIKGVYVIGKTDGKGYVKRSNPDFANAQDVIRLEVMDNIVIAKRIDNPSAGWGMFLCAITILSCVLHLNLSCYSASSNTTWNKVCKEVFLINQYPEDLSNFSKPKQHRPTFIVNGMTMLKRMAPVFIATSLTNKLSEIGGSSVVECFWFCSMGMGVLQHTLLILRDIILLAEGNTLTKILAPSDRL